jgi:cytochrome c peroxidase
VSRALVIAAVLVGCAPTVDDPDPQITPEAMTALRALHYDASPPPPDPSDRVADDPEAAAFGQRLFFDPSFSGRLLEGDNDGTNATLGSQGESGRVSCAGCHIASAGFVDTRSPHQQVSLGAQWTLRRTPTLLEIAFAPLYNWDGRRDAIWNQALGVMESERELNSSRLFVAEQIFRTHRAEYERVFGVTMPPLDDASRFPQLTSDTTGCIEQRGTGGSTFVCRGRPGDGADYDGMTAGDQQIVTTVVVDATKAIEAYVRQLRCGPGRFDDWLDGDTAALDRAEQRGAALFVGAAGCVQCHGGPRLTDDAFHDVGLSPAVVAVAIHDIDDRGAAEGVALALDDPMSTAGPYSDGDRHALPAVTPALEGAFRTPTLRCVDGHPSYMHTAQIGSLEDVVSFFDRGGDPSGYSGTNELHALHLSARDRADLVAFLGALTGPGPQPALLEAP